MNRLAGCGLALVASAVLLPAAQAQFNRPSQAIKYRQSAMYVQQIHLTRILAMANGRQPYDKAVVLADAEVLATVAHLPWVAFGPGTEGGQARPEVWSEPAKFKEATEQLQAEAAKLLAAAKSDDLEAVKAAARAVDGSCRSCHRAFDKG